jgi:hypothetical protein
MIGRKPRLMLGCFLVAAIACGDSIVRVCTLLGCVGGLTIALQGPGAARVVRLELTAPGDSTRRWICSVSTPCTSQDGVFFPDYTPPTVMVTYVTDAGSSAVNLSPTYQTFRPNGPDCGPECRGAKVVLNVP